MARNTIIREKSPEVPAESAWKCAGCRESFRKQELITAHEGHHMVNRDLLPRAAPEAPTTVEL